MKNWERNIRKVVPYVPGEQPDIPDMIKLNTNENPYPPSPDVLNALQGFDSGRLRLYPDPTAQLLVKEIASYHSLSTEQVFVGVGSDDVIAMSFLTFFNSKKPVFFPDITYSFYDVWADLFGISYETKALDADFRIRALDYYGENGGVIFPNPNAPTGVYENLAFIEDILTHNQDCIVIVDEAYIDFGGVSARSLLARFENLLVVQTFSKSRSMAGVRIGYAMGSPVLIKYLNDVKYSFNSYTINQTSLVCGAASIRDDAYFRETCEKIIETREWTKKELSLLGFSFPDSLANFLFVTHPEYGAQDLFTALKQAHIFVRYFNRPRIDNYLRITIGTPEEMRALIAFLKSYMKK